MTPGRRLKKWAVRQWIPATGAAVAFAAIIAATAVAMWSSQPPPAKPLPPRADSEQIARERLRSGQSALIVGEKGYPAWLRENFLTGPGGLGTSPAAEGAMAYGSVQPSQLAIMRDPGIDNYQLTAEIMLESFPGENGNKPELFPSAGIFILDTHASGESGSDVHSFLRIQFTDYLPPAIFKSGEQGVVQLNTGLNVQAKGESVSTPGGAHTPPIKFEPSKSLPSDWHQIRTIVSTSGVKAYWRLKPGRPDAPSSEFKLIAELGPEQIHSHLAENQNWLDRFQPGFRIALPGWTPRSPIGIWNRRSAIAVRNVLIEPLP